MRKLSLTLAFTALLAVVSFAQKKFLIEADKAFDAKEYFKAVDLYKSAYTAEKKADKKARILFRTAESYRHINQIKEAESYYSKAIKAKYPDPISYFYIGEIKKEQKLYNEAITEYENYKKEVPSDPMVEARIKSCELAQKWVDAPTRHKVENMSLFNSKDADFSPSFADKKSNKLMFTSTREGTTGASKDESTGWSHSDLFETTLDKNGKWSTPVPIGLPINTEVNEGAAVVSKKGDMIIFSRVLEIKGKKERPNLYMSAKAGAGWGEPKLISFCVDSINFAHPTLSADGNTMYFASNMGGTLGHADIWMSHYNKKAKDWDMPVNLGSIVNTAGQEMYPYVTADGKFLYFSSDTHLGMGGLDIFKVELDKDGKPKGQIENLKYPLNSAADDFGIMLEGTKERGYLSSNREGGKGGDDIWSFVLPPLVFNVSGTVKNAEDKTPVANCPVILKGSDGTLVQSKSDASGSFTMALKPEVTYDIYTQTDKSVTTKTAPMGFLASEDHGNFTTVGLQESQNFEKAFELTPVKDEIKLPSILFETAKWDVRPQFQDSLNFLYNVLIKNPTITIELSAHTDSRGSTKSNDDLSQKRAQSCVDYLISKGIPKERMTAKGWGERKLKIQDAQVTKEKTKEGKEALHAINRRVVFKILSWDYVDPTKPKVEIPAYHPPVKGEEDSEKLETVTPEGK
ncbi:MAG: outer membrane protein/peptidoglycan-associated protein [Bacteroidetes bacterium]|nr:outer membrane protein/peptidoglycan-associated protein [Bacteroidota bacterium]